MFKYSNFILESQLELINESILYLSPKLKKILIKINDEISKDILSLELEDIKDDITFVDLSDEAGYVDFSTSKNVKKNLQVKYPEDLWSDIHKLFEIPKPHLATNLYNLGNETWTKSRVPIRIGKLVNKLFPGKYTSNQLEEFTNKLKGSLIRKGDRTILVKGDDIAYWYDSDNYYDNTNGSLASSCMKNKPSSYFTIYTKNPEVCQMICIISEDDYGKDRLKARALVWKITESNRSGFEYFMDRQYTVDEGYTEKLRSYAKEQGWAFRTYNSLSNESSITFEDKHFSCNMMIQLNKPYSHEEYPYMDTFKRYDVYEGQLFNDSDESYSDNYILEETNGGYRESNAVYSEYTGDMIPESDAVWSVPLQSYLPERESVEVRTGSRRHLGFWPSDHEDIVYDDFNNRYLHIDDAIYSEEYGYYIALDDSVSVVHYIKDDGDCNEDQYFLDVYDSHYVSFSYLEEFIWFQNIKSKNRNWEEHYGIMKTLLDKDDDGDWILKKFKIRVYKLEKPIGSFEWISEIDAELLQLEIDENDYKTSDDWSYTDDLKDANLVDKLKRAINNKLSQITIEFGGDFDKPSKDEEEYLRKRLKDLDNFSV